MPDEPRFIIGFGERLTEPVSSRGRPGGPVSPYDEATARERLASAALEAADAADELPAIACPRDEVVTVLTLHPSFLAKSYYPDALLQVAGFSAVGSRPVQILPEAIARRSRDADGEQIVTVLAPEAERPTTELFVATTRSNLHRWSTHLASHDSLIDGEADIVKVEAFRLPSIEERLRVPSDELLDEMALEVVLHSGDSYVLDGFEVFASSLEVDASLERRIDTGGVCFVPAVGPGASLRDLAQFSFVRAVRSMPRLRQLTPMRPITRNVGGASAVLPDEPPVDPDLRVAVFDGGLPAGSCLERWVDAYEFPGMSPEVPEFTEHGQHVSSALLFGPVEPGEVLPRPYAYVDHFRVLDDQSSADPFELYDVIERIDSVLSQSDYEFVSLSIGPDLPIEDDEVHAWTAFWDQTLADGHTLAAVAVGNNGDLDRDSGNARVQVPSDCVNALAVGAATTKGANWKRATYSAVGPGRSPGLVKPDVVNFGGTLAEPFLVVGQDKGIDGTCGTSFATPATMRSALGVRAMFGSRITPLTARALVVHTAENFDDVDRAECGWGRVLPDLADMVICGDGEARVLYQGELSPGKYLRARLPLPARLPNGMVTITATLVFATEVDPQDPGNYTRSGVDITFRPHSERYQPDSDQLKTRPFFGRSGYASEGELRNDAHKWETVLHESTRMRASSLKNPVFDIHYNAREGGRKYSTAPRIRYAMILTVRMPKHPTLYEDVLSSYSTQLEAMTPVLSVPLRVET